MNNQAVLLVLAMAMTVLGLGLSVVGGMTGNPFLGLMGWLNRHLTLTQRHSSDTLKNV